ncbi:hypothetical protein [Spiroplasma endosymbiont of Nebria brevicollis]|uniref:hypothetical protein n=1 Tax=Spiroplasma endosymbiont of Nebria brevicollis TaxID=3066284 RepID=UPI00313AE73F
MNWLLGTTHEIILVKIAVIATFFMIVFLIPAVLLCNSIEKKKSIKNKSGIIGICFSILVFMCIIIVALATFTNIF